VNPPTAGRDVPPDRRTQEFTAFERRALFNINQQVAAATSLDEAMDFLYESIGEMCSRDRISLLIIDEEEQSAAIQWTRCAGGECLRLRPGYSVALPDEVLEQPLASGQVLLIGNIEKPGVSIPGGHWLNELAHEGQRSGILCPLHVNERAFGVLVVMSHQPYSFGYHERQMLEVVRERVSQALLTAFMIDELQATNRAYLEMLGFVSHELKNPLAAIVMDGKLLAQGYVGELSEAQERRVGKVVAKGQYLLSLIREYLDLSRIESGELTAHPHPDVELVEHVIAPALEMVGAQIEEREMRLVRVLPDDLRPITVDPELMLIVMVNLLGNAAKYGRDGGELRLTIEQYEEGLKVVVWNEGPGFPLSARSRLFRKFSRIQTPELMKRKGTGVGLYTVWQVVRLHGGSVWADSEEGAWAEFGFEIPQPLACPT